MVCQMSHLVCKFVLNSEVWQQGFLFLIKWFGSILCKRIWISKNQNCPLLTSRSPHSHTKNLHSNINLLCGMYYYLYKKNHTSKGKPLKFNKYEWRYLLTTLFRNKWFRLEEMLLTKRFKVYPIFMEQEKSQVVFFISKFLK